MNDLRAALEKKFGPAQEPKMSRRQAHVAVCVPSQDLVHAKFHTCMLRLMHTTLGGGVNFHPIQCNDTILQRSRSMMANQALSNAGVTHLLYIDSDMTFPPDAVLQLLRRDLDIVGANYRTRHHTDPNEIGSVSRCLDDQVVDSRGRTGLQEVLHTGTGFLMIRREVFEAMRKPWFETTYREMHDDWMGEDVFFCVMARQAGYKVWIDHDLSRQIGHIGAHEFRWE